MFMPPDSLIHAFSAACMYTSALPSSGVFRASSLPSFPLAKHCLLGSPSRTARPSASGFYLRMLPICPGPRGGVSESEKTNFGHPSPVGTLYFTKSVCTVQYKPFTILLASVIFAHISFVQWLVDCVVHLEVPIRLNPETGFLKTRKRLSVTLSP